MTEKINPRTDNIGWIRTSRGHDSWCTHWQMRRRMGIFLKLGYATRVPRGIYLNFTKSLASKFLVGDIVLHTGSCKSLVMIIQLKSVVNFVSIFRRHSRSRTQTRSRG